MKHHSAFPQSVSAPSASNSRQARPPWVLMVEKAKQIANMELKITAKLLAAFGAILIALLSYIWHTEKEEEKERWEEVKDSLKVLPEISTRVKDLENWRKYSRNENLQDSLSHSLKPLTEAMLAVAEAIKKKNETN